ncbi:MAG: SusC/RagA family TonB-linked outer membrane protein [Bacteroidota bacterium]
MKKLLLVFTIMVIAASTMLAQRTISGTVTDDGGETLIGANILVKGTSSGTVTDLDGKYSIEVPATSKILVISYTGFSTQEVEIGVSDIVDITLTQGVFINEVVVTGTGAPTDKRRTAISVESIDARDLPNVPSGSVDDALTGRIPGAWISSTSGQPGQQANILLRGINSLGTTQPMILIDGVQMNTDNGFNGIDGNLSSSRLADIDMNNVERIEVVQGAAAATIYGAQGANGVIQIFTKKGKANSKPSVSFETSVGSASPLEGKWEKAENHVFVTNGEGFLADGTGTQLQPDEFGRWPDPVLESEEINITDNPYREALPNQFDQIFRSALNHRHSLSIRGGADRSTYAFTGSYTFQESALVGNQDKVNLGLNLGYEVFDNLSVNIGTDLIIIDNTTGQAEGGNDGGGVGDLSNLILSYPFIDYANRVDFNGQQVLPSTPSGIADNPLYGRENILYNNSTFRLFPRVGLTYTPNDWLELDYKYGYDQYRYNYQRYDRFQNEFVDAASGQNGLGATAGRIRQIFDKGVTQNSVASMFLRPDLQKHFGLSAPITGTTQVSFDWRKRSLNRSEAIGTELPPFEPVTIRAAGVYTADEFIEDFVTYGFLINQKIEYSDYFGVSGGVRIDWSSAFGLGSDPFVFPRGDIYWRPSSMNFWGNLKSTINEFKVRGAYGKAGIQPGAFDRIVTLDATTAGATGILSPPLELPNESLDVQVSTEVEAGIDASLTLLGASSNYLPYLGISFTYWDRTTDDVIRAIDVANSSGIGSILDNSITLESNGIQLSLNTTVMESKAFRWNFTTNFTRQRTIVSEIVGADEIPVATFFSIQEGDELGLFRGQEVLTSLDAVDANGNLILEDPSGFEISPEHGYVVNTETKRPVLSPDVTILGSGLPDFNVSFINDFTIADFVTISAQLDWVQGQDIYNVTKQWTFRDNTHGDVDDPVTIGGESAAFFNYYQTLYNTRDPNSHFVENGSFLRLRNLTLAFDLDRVLDTKKFKNLRLILTGTNLFTITDYSGFDPEASNAFNNPLVVGFDEFTMPNNKTYQVALRVGF